MRKRNTTAKILKKDIADLLKNGLESNAYGRAEGLITELNRSSCYNLIDQFCEHIGKQLSCMQKQRECPPESREAVSSLIFAAARFSDLPELRNLRSIFTERFGNALESSVNQEFVQRMSSDPPLMDKKLHLMRSISKEFFIKWDSKAFEQKISNPSSSACPQPKKYEPLLNSNDDRPLRKPLSGRDNSTIKMGNKEISSPLSGRDNSAIKMGNKEISSNERQELTPWHTSRQLVKTDSKEIHIITSINNGCPPYPPDTTEKVSMEEAQFVKRRYTNNMIPPYVKPKDKSRTNSEARYGEPAVPLVNDVRGSNNRSEKPCTGSDRTSHERQVVGLGHATSTNGFGDYKDYQHYPDNSVSDGKLKPRSSRKKHQKPPSVQDNDGTTNGNKLASRSQNGRKRRSVRRNIPISTFDHDHDDGNDEEKIMDRLLIHYSKKQSTCEAGRVNKGLKDLVPHDGSADKSPPILNKNRPNLNLGSGIPPPRSVSLPVEHTNLTEVSRKPVRAASLQPDMNSNGRSVHPKLPDYDDLTARIAAFRGA